MKLNFSNFQNNVSDGPPTPERHYGALRTRMDMCLTPNQAESKTWFWFCYGAVSDGARCQGPRDQCLGSGVRGPASGVRHRGRASWLRRPKSSVGSPVSNTCNQSPGIPVCYLLLMIMLRFTCREREICSTIKNSQNIINMIVWYLY